MWKGKKMKKINFDCDVVIVGAGPAALTAAIYAQRGNLKTIFIEKGAPGGKLPFQSKIENWPGNKLINGADLALEMYQHALSFGAEHVFGEVEKIVSISEFEKQVFYLDYQKKIVTLNTKAVVIASGMKSRIPEEIEGIYEFENRGVSYCAICDGPLFKNQKIGVIGGGNSAVEEAVFLSSVAEKVKVFVLDKKFNAEPFLIEDLQKKTNVQIFFNSQVKKLVGKDNLKKAEVLVDGKMRTFELAALFPFIGFLPNTSFLKNLDILDNQKFIITNENCETKIRGVYAIGDVRKKEIRQITTAAADGTIVGKILTNRIPK